MEVMGAPDGGADPLTIILVERRVQMSYSTFNAGLKRRQSGRWVTMQRHSLLDAGVAGSF